MNACRVILIGMMGSGKSTIGKLLSEATGWPYVDNDELLGRSHGQTSRQLLAEQGEAAMRAAETSALVLGVDVPEPAIVGLAAGTILDPANRERLRGAGVVVYLRAAADTLAARAQGAEHRPWIGQGGNAWMREATAEREPLYASVADITVDTGSRVADAVADELRQHLLARAPCRALERPDANPVGPATGDG